MANPATTADIVARWRPLTAAETIVAGTRLEDAWRKLKKDVPDLETRMATDSDLTDDAIRVLADAVIRVLQSNERNGVRKGSIGVDDASRSWELDASIQASLYFTDDEIADLSSTGRRRGARAYSVRPS
jgi:hypothetical protein